MNSSINPLIKDLQRAYNNKKYSFLTIAVNNLCSQKVKVFVSVKGVDVECESCKNGFLYNALIQLPCKNDYYYCVPCYKNLLNTQFSDNYVRALLSDKLCLNNCHGGCKPTRGLLLTIYDKHDFEKKEKELYEQMYLEEKEREKEAKKPRKIQCGVCGEENPQIEFLQLYNCSHWQCINCTKEYLMTQMDQLKIRDEDIACWECGATLHPDDISACLKNAPGEQAGRLDFLRIRILNGVRGCPGVNCKQYFELDPAEKASYVECNGCMHKFCPLCMDKPHKGMTCEQYREEIRLKDQNNKILEQDEQFLNDKYCRCPKCKTLVEHTGGCHQITCWLPNCRTKFCYVCRVALVQGAYCPGKHIKGH